MSDDSLRNYGQAEIPLVDPVLPAVLPRLRHGFNGYLKHAKPAKPAQPAHPSLIISPTSASTNSVATLQHFPKDSLLFFSHDPRPRNHGSLTPRKRARAPTHRVNRPFLTPFPRSNYGEPPTRRAPKEQNVNWENSSWSMEVRAWSLLHTTRNARWWCAMGRIARNQAE